MKLTKTKLEKILTPSLESMGYTKFKDTISGFQGLYVKKISLDLFLTLGTSISRYFNDSFTGNFYLSKSTRIGSIWGDIPKKSYERIGFLLTDEELDNYRDEGSQLRDIWWKAFAPSSVDDFLFRVKQCEPRICNDLILREEIEKSIDVKKLHELSIKVMEIVDNLPEQCNYKFIPPKEIDGIPMKWFMAAEKVLCSSKSVINKNTVKDLASDTYIQFQINHGIRVSRGTGD